MSRETFQSLRMLLMEKLDLARELTDEEILEEIDTLILERMRDSCLSLKEKVQLRQELFHSVRKLDVLQELIEDETVTEIMVNGPDAIFVERAGKLSRWEKTFTSGEKLEDVIQQIVGKCNRVVNESMPIVDARLENGARVNAVVRPVALNGPILTIRRFPDTPITMEKLIALGSLPAECAEFLKTLVRARYSMVIGGGTGSGKTTFLGALSNFIPSDERLITIEDNAELKIQGIENLVRLEAKMANAYVLDGKGPEEITLPDVYAYTPIGAFVPLPKVWMHNTVKVHAWTGADETAFSGETREPEEMVYVTETGTVYHKKAGCRYLKVSINQISGSSLTHARNDSGQKYSPCESCSRNQKPSGVVYVTSSGNRYHNLATCSGLKRTVKLVKESQLGGMHACSSCG